MIENPRAPRVRAVAKLVKKAARSQTGLFLVEGPQAVGEALSWRPDLVVDLFVTPTALERHPVLAALAAEADREVTFVSEGVLDAIADTVTPQGVVAVARQFPVAVRDVFRPGDEAPHLVAVLDEVRDPGNAGTIIRVADAVGADAVIFTGRSVDPFHPKVVRATTGSLFHVPVSLSGDLGEVAALARECGLQLLAADISGEDVLAVRSSGRLARPTAWLFGNEARGLDEVSLALVDAAVTVPIYGRAESLNLATAASVCLYESAFAQRAEGDE